MPDKQMYATAPRGNWPWVAAILAVVIVAAALAWVLVRDESDATGPEGGSGGEDTGGSSIETTGTVVPAAGCLGGQGDLNEAVRIAQQEAPLTGDGAAAFLATFWRWYGSSSTSQLEVDELADELMVPDLTGKYTQRPETTNGEAYGVSLVDKHYKVLEQDQDRVKVAFTLSGTDASGQVNATAGLVAYAILVDDRWRWGGWDDAALDEAAGEDAGRAWRTELDATGIPFQEAC